MTKPTVSYMTVQAAGLKAAAVMTKIWFALSEHF